jgi:hypothetical protein
MWVDVMCVKGLLQMMRDLFEVFMLWEVSPPPDPAIAALEATSSWLPRAPGGRELGGGSEQPALERHRRRRHSHDGATSSGNEGE